MSLLDKIFGTFSDKELRRIAPIVAKIEALAPVYAAMTDTQLQAVTPALKARLAAGETLDDLLPDAFAACSEAAWRVLGQRPFHVQLIGGAVLHRASIAEMKTGEGKTLTATLPVYLNALTGEGVHVVTVNDYLALYQSEWIGKLYRFLGMSVGLIAHDMEPDERRAAYACDITYGTNNEFGFDYLRDNMAVYKERLVQRGHAYAIVDEVDSILIDEARTPLIISGAGEESTELYTKADAFAKTLRMRKVVEQNSKLDMDDTESEGYVDGDYLVDEKAKSATLTASGIEKAEKYFGLENLSDPENMELSHHIKQAIKARGVMKRDVDYVVKDGEIVIVDEFTGRLMTGRRYNEGLHQAIEAKEGVTVARESKTLASITFQNYFRMYKKLAGMTGTAKTEAEEFSEIYGLQVVEVPTNRPVIRIDHTDALYATEQQKFAAIIDQVAACHAKGQPVLVGTVSIEKSELLSRMLKKRGIKHNVLNAKHHEKEAEIVAQAGQYGAVTIATNMAGRGTDILLGGNADFMAKSDLRRQMTEGEEGPVPRWSEELLAEADGHADTDDADILAVRAEYDARLAKHKADIAAEADRVRAAGGLFIIGTERHESRRIDNQLRGRSGRQGDPGESKFFLSTEDDLLRIFGENGALKMLKNTLGQTEGASMEYKMFASTIERAQKSIEGRNFGIRKTVLQYDDVLNNQRAIIYKQRQQVLADSDVSESIHRMLRESVENQVLLFCNAENPADWNLEGLRAYYQGWMCGPQDFRYSEGELAVLTPQDISSFLIERAMRHLQEKEARLGSARMRELERAMLLRAVDREWMDHIDAMEELRRSIGLRGYAQRDPVIEYRVEGSDMFDAMVEAIRENAVRMTMIYEIVERRQMARPQTAVSAGGEPARSKPVRVEKIGRNDPCPCGSGKKWKKCTCAQYHPELAKQ